MAEVSIPEEFIVDLRRFAANFEWANKNFNLLKDHTNQYVAIADEKVLAFSSNKEELQDRFGEVKGVYIDLITPEYLQWIL